MHICLTLRKIMRNVTKKFYVEFTNKEGEIIHGISPPVIYAKDYRRTKEFIAIRDKRPNGVFGVHVYDANYKPIAVYAYTNIGRAVLDRDFKGA